MGCNFNACNTNGGFAVRALQTELRIDFISVELTTARTMAGSRRSRFAAIICRTRGSVDQGSARVRGRCREANPARRPDDRLANPQDRTLLAPERRRTHEWLKMAFYAQPGALGWQVSFIQYDLIVLQKTSSVAGSFVG